MAASVSLCGTLACLETDDSLFAVWAIRGLGDVSALLRCWNVMASRGCAEVRLVKDSRFDGFQLESLILAQNERWRQA